MFRLPSLERLYASCRDTLLRFPLVLISGTVCFLLVSFSILYPSHNNEALWRPAFAAMLGIPLFFSLACYRETAKDAPPFWALPAFGCALLYAYYLSYNENAPTIFVYRFFQFSLGLHLVVSFAPYIKRGNLNGFWQFNRILFLRFIESAVYSGVLYLGLALALLAIDHLLGIKIDSKLYSILYCFMTYVFNTWFFLAGMPEDLQSLDMVQEYPSSLKVFTQFILIPLVTLYFVILYCYMGKILLLREWPKGTVGWLVATISTFGVFSMLLAYPLAQQEDQRWIRIYARWFYLALFPLIVLLLMAIGTRVSRYGMTENRYFLLMLAIWISVIACHFTFSRERNIKLIPLSLAGLAFFTSFGPWSGYAVSKFSQRRRLQSHLEALGILVKGKIQKATVPVPLEQAKDITESIEYLLHMHGVPSIQEWFDEDLNPKTTTPPYRYSIFTHFETSPAREKALSLMGVPYTTQWQVTQKNFFYITDFNKLAYSVEGYDTLYKINSISWTAANASSFSANGKTYRVFISSSSTAMSMLEGDQPAIDIPLQPLLKNLANVSPNQVPPDLMAAEGENENFKIRLLISQVYGLHKDGGDSITTLQGDLLIKFKHR